MKGQNVSSLLQSWAPFLSTPVSTLATDARQSPCLPVPELFPKMRQKVPTKKLRRYRASSSDELSGGENLNLTDAMLTNGMRDTYQRAMVAGLAIPLHHGKEASTGYQGPGAKSTQTESRSQPGSPAPACVPTAAHRAAASSPATLGLDPDVLSAGPRVPGGIGLLKCRWAWLSLLKFLPRLYVTPGTADTILPGQDELDVATYLAASGASSTDAALAPPALSPDDKTGFAAPALAEIAAAQIAARQDRVGVLPSTPTPAPLTMIEAARSATHPTPTRRPDPIERTPEGCDVTAATALLRAWDRGEAFARKRLFQAGHADRRSADVAFDIDGSSTGVDSRRLALAERNAPMLPDSTTIKEGGRTVKIAGSKAHGKMMGTYLR